MKLCVLGRSKSFPTSICLFLEVSTNIFKTDYTRKKSLAVIYMLRTIILIF